MGVGGLEGEAGGQIPDPALMHLGNLGERARFRQGIVAVAVNGATVQAHQLSNKGRRAHPAFYFERIHAGADQFRDLLDQAQTGLEGLELNIGTKLEQLASTGKTLKTTKDFLDGNISDIETADPAQTSAELLNDQNMLEASYNILVRLSNLSLTKYLN
jgi:flagellin-like hook-associated protein FlgL